MDTDIERSRTFSWHDPLASLAAASQMSGLEYLEALKAGRVPPAPMAELLGFRLVEVSEGSVTFTAQPQEYFYNGIGLIHGGFTATLLDTAIGCAVLTTISGGKVATTSDLHVRYFRPVTMESGTIRCEGRIVNSGRTTATAEGRVLDEAGRLYAHGTSTLALIVPDARHFPGLKR